jgi:hypothetical protein
MSHSLLKGQEEVYLCSLSLQGVFENEDQWTLKERVWQSCGFQKKSSKNEIVPAIKRRNWRCVSCEGWKHSWT